MAGLDDPIKTVFVSVYDIAGNQLATTGDVDGISVVSFRYKYNDEDEDTCIIKLQMKSSIALDQLNIGRGSRLQCVWGYIGSPVSPTVTVVVRDMTSKYGADLIYTELECTDYLTFIKTVRSSDIGEGKFIDYIKAQTYGQYNIDIRDRDTRLYAQVKRKQDANKDQRVLVSVPYSGDLSNMPIFDPLDESPEGSRVASISNKPTEAGTWFVDATHPVRKFLEEEKGILTSNRSTFVVMQDLFRKCPRGPWFVTGRGDTLLIHNRNLGKGIYKEYIYQSEFHGLVDFTGKTKFENFDKELISYAGMDPSARKNYFIDDYRKALFNQRGLKEILQDRKITPEQKEDEIRDWLNLRQGGYKTFHATKIKGSFINIGTDLQRFVPGHPENPFVIRYPEQYIAVQDKTANPNPDPYLRSKKGGFDPKIHDEILRAIWYTVPLMTYDEAVNVTNNRQRELAMDKETGEVILEGDPWIRSELTIRISNVHKQHSGQYYIKECEHLITNQGYKTTLDCLKVIPEASIITLGNITQEVYDGATEEVKQLIDEQYKREQLLFGDTVKIHYVKDNEVLIQGTPTPLSTPTVTGTGHHSITLGELFTKAGSDDKAIEELVKLSGDSRTFFEFNPENQ